jgi:CheY-like chemotaxis protein
LARKILLADDSVTAQNMGRKILADAGYEVITVNNGSAALKKIAEHKPDLIVLDVYMPGYSGLEVCSRLKENGETSRLPVLLTVGKLEPFKPEEARRVRADGFIVKPFEASELLSALSKLEDKIVPRAESSKPGRFARAIASVEESGRNHGDADAGWKNRIGFPKNKEKTEDEADEPAIYNAVNKGLRTVVIPEPFHPVAKSAPSDEPCKDEPRREKDEAETPAERCIDVGAVAVPGLPADVTAEEIAGLAAAMAQVQATLSAKEAETVIGTTNVTSAVEPQPPAMVEGVKPEVNSEVKNEEKPAERVEADASTAPEPTMPPRTSHADVIAAVAALEPANGKGWDGDDSGNGAGHSHDGQFAAENANVPATMAAASRWTAVPVALAADEVAISLEYEMQKAYAALVAAESAPAESTASSPQLSAEPISLSSVSAVAEVADNRAPSRVEEELALALSAVANASPETVSAVATELASVAAHSDVTSVSQPDETAAVAQSPVGHDLVAPDAETPAQHEQPVQQEQAPQSEDVSPAIESAVAAPVTPEAPGPLNAPTSATEETSTADISQHPSEVGADESSFAPQPVSVQAEAAPPASDPVAESTGKITESHEPDLAATTAAAWANWREIRNSSETQAAEPATGGQKEIEENESAHSRDAAAMAVAAGAESSPEEVSSANDDDPAISSIVDSVLADLRPKIVEEISRKLKKRK